MSEIISSKDIQPVVIQVASAEDAATLARIETGIRTAAQNVVQGYLTIGSYLNEAKGRKIVPHGQWEDWVLYNTGLSLRQAQQLMKAAREIPEGSAMAALPLSKARVILHLPDAEERETLAKRATEENLTVRNLEEQIKQLTNDVSEARKSEHRMAQEVQQAQDMRARLDADRRKLEGDRYEMIQKQRERQAEIERLRAALAQAEQQKPQEGISRKPSDRLTRCGRNWRTRRTMPNNKPRCGRKRSGSYWSSRAARRAVWAIYRIRWILRPLSAYLSARRVSSRTWAPRWPTWTAASGGNWRAMWT